MLLIAYIWYLHQKYEQGNNLFHNIIDSIKLMTTLTYSLYLPVTPLSQDVITNGTYHTLRHLRSHSFLTNFRSHYGRHTANTRVWPTHMSPNYLTRFCLVFVPIWYGGAKCFCPPLGNPRANTFQQTSTHRIRDNTIQSFKTHTFTSISSEITLFIICFV